MRISCHLSFDGECEKAFLAYQRILGGSIQTMLRFGESPLADQVPSEWQSKILHATLILDSQELLGSDAFPGAAERPGGFSVTLSLSDVERASEVFSLLSERGSIRMPFQETFWSPGFGVLIDRFGVPWEVNCEKSAILT